MCFLGSCGRVANLKHGEVMYKANHFTRKPTEAASIAMWVKSRKPGLVRWFDVSDSAGSTGKDSANKLVKVPKNQWIHLAGTFDSKNGIARVYVNGKLISETVGKKNKGLPDDFTATGIGQKFGDKFISFLDDVFMFDRVISPAEVRMLYKKCEFNRMVLHFGFQKANTTAHQVMDQSGLENNATLEGGKIRTRVWLFPYFVIQRRRSVLKRGGGGGGEVGGLIVHQAKRIYIPLLEFPKMSFA